MTRNKTTNNSALVDIDQYRGAFSGSDVDSVLPRPAATDDEYIRRMDSYRDGFAEDTIRRRVCDANESLIFAQALEYWIAESLDQQYPEYFADTLIPMRRNIPPGAATVVAYGYDKTGQAGILSGLGEDIPRVDLHARRMTSPMIGLAAAFAVSQQQIREAAQSPNNPQIESMGLDAVRLVLRERTDRILALGDAVTGCQGILNVTGAGVGNFVTGGWSVAGGATAAQIDGDVNAAIAAIKLATGNVFRPDTLLLPTIAYNYIATLPMFALGPLTVLDWLRTTHRLNVVEFWRCDGAGVGGVDRAALLVNNRQVIEGYRSIDIELLAPEYRSTYYLTVGHARTGGVNSANATAIGYYDNV